MNLSFAKGDKLDRDWSGQVDRYVDAYTPADWPDNEGGSCDKAKEKETPDETVQMLLASGVDICKSRIVSSNPQVISMDRHLYDCRKGELTVKECNRYVGGGFYNQEKGKCGIECSAGNLYYLKAKFPTFQTNADTCTYIRAANQNKYTAVYDKVVGGDSARYFKISNLPCARHTCPNGETQGLWEGMHVHFEDDFDSCCHSCRLPYVVGEDRGTCQNFIDSVKPDQCYSKCGVGLSEATKKVIQDKFACTDEEMVLMEEAIAESKLVHGAGSRIASGASITSAIVVLAAAVMNFH